MRVLLTRAQDDAEDMKIRIEQLGVSVSLAPLLQVSLLPIVPGLIQDVSGIVATSRNGLKALAQSQMQSAIFQLPLFAVGPATAALARQFGFINIVEGPGTAGGLAPVIESWRNRLGPGPLVQLAGDQLAFDLVDALAKTGIAVRQIHAYRIGEATALPQSVQLELAEGRIDAVLLMSPRTAKIWSNLVIMAGLEGRLSNLTHVCLSRSVADGLQSLPSPEIAVADKPREPEILSLIRRLAADARTR